jgi:hypothetical protein
MKNLAWEGSACAFVGAGIVAVAAAYLAHTVLGMPRAVIRYDALGWLLASPGFSSLESLRKGGTNDPTQSPWDPTSSPM